MTQNPAKFPFSDSIYIKSSLEDERKLRGPRIMRPSQCISRCADKPRMNLGVDLFSLQTTDNDGNSYHSLTHSERNI